MSNWENLSFDEYLNHPALGAHDLSSIIRSPAHFKEDRRKPPTKQMLDGTLRHDALLFPDSFKDRTVLVPTGHRGKPETKEAWKKFLKQCQKEDKLTETTEEIMKKGRPAKEWDCFFKADINRATNEDFEEIKEIQDKLSKDELAQKLLSSSQKELSGFMAVPCEVEVVVKTRPDIICAQEKAIADIKFTNDCRRFGRTMFDFRYDIQSALQLNISRAIEPETDFTDYYWIVIDDTPPFEYKFFHFDIYSEFYATAFDHVKEAIKTTSRCAESGVWPGYDKTPIEVNYPKWGI